MGGHISQLMAEI